MKVTMLVNGKVSKAITKREFLTFFQEYFDINNAEEMWLDVVEYGETMPYTTNGVTYKFRK